MRKLLIVLMVISVISILGCSQESSAPPSKPEDTLLSNLPAKLEPIEDSPFALPTFPPEVTPETIQTDLIYDSLFIETPESFKQVIKYPKITYAITPEKFEESLNFRCGDSEENAVPCQPATISDDGTLNIYSTEQIIGFDGPAFNQYDVSAGGNQKPLGILVKFKSRDPRVLRFVFRGQNEQHGVDYETGIEFNFFDNSDIIFCSYKGREEGAPKSETSIFSNGGSSFQFYLSTYYYMFVSIDRDSNVFFFVWQEDDPHNCASYTVNINQSFGTDQQFKDLDWSFNFNSNYGSGSLNLLLAESYILTFDKVD